MTFMPTQSPPGFPSLPPLLQQILFGGGISPSNPLPGATPPFFPMPSSAPVSTPSAAPIASPSGIPNAKPGLFGKADAFLEKPSGQFLMNLLAQSGFSTTPQSPIGAIGRAGLMTAQQRQQDQATDLQRRLIESQIGVNAARAEQGGNATAGNVQSTFEGSNGNMFLVTRGGNVKDTGVKYNANLRIVTRPDGSSVLVDPARGADTKPVEVVSPEEAVSGAAARSGAEAQASTAARESTEQQFKLPERINAAQSRIREIDSTMDEANRALGLVGPLSTGGVGGLLANIPYTDAFKLREAIKPVQAALSFDRLQAMRDASPTGGALGQVSERELDLLGAALVSLNQAQEPGDVKRALMKVLTHYGNWKSIIEQQAANLQGQQAGNVSGFRIVDPNGGN